jgi:alanine racemase
VTEQPSSYQIPWTGAQTARAIIDLDALAANVAQLRKFHGGTWMAILKANAYGHGLGPMALACMRQGATWLGVAQLHEALRLREYLDAAGVKPVDAAQLAQNPALATAQTPRIFTWIMPPVSAQEAAQADSGLRQALRAKLDLSASTVEVLQAIIAAAQAEGKCAYVHLKVDTGMARAGANLEDLADLAQCAAQAQSQGHIKVVALWSHLARADEILIPATGQQLERYCQGLQILADAGIDVPVRHLAATAGTLWHPDTAALDMDRFGIGLYGLSPDHTVARAQDLGLHPIMRLEARLTQVKHIKAGQGVSYGATWQAPTDRWVGLVPLGYGDGILRSASDRAPILVGKQRTHIVGRVCMDQVIVDLGPTSNPDGTPRPAPARAGDLAILFGDPAPLNGPANPAIPTAEDWATACGTISYEVVTQLRGAHLPRYYVSQGSYKLAEIPQ